MPREGNFNISIYWRPLTQEELAELSSGDLIVLRQNYLYNPERLLVTYVKAKCVERSKRATTLVSKGSDTMISVGLTEVGCFQDDGWKMSPEEWEKIRRGDPVLVYRDSGERRLARFATGAQHFSAKVNFEGETELSLSRRKTLDAINESAVAGLKRFWIVAGVNCRKRRASDISRETLERCSPKSPCSFSRVGFARVFHAENFGPLIRLYLTS